MKPYKRGKPDPKGLFCWYVTVDIGRQDGKRKQKCVKLGRMTYSQAKVEASKVVGDAASGAISAGRETVNDMLASWMAYGKLVWAQSTYEHYEVKIRVHIAPYLGQFEVRKLTDKMILAFYENMRDKGSGGSLPYCHQILSASLHHAIDVLGWIVRSPLRNITKPRATREPIGLVDPLLVRKLLDEADSLPFFLSLATGMRRSELCGLCWDSVLFDRRGVMVRRKVEHTEKYGTRILAELKTRASTRYIPVPAIMMGRLADLLAEVRTEPGFSLSWPVVSPGGGKLTKPALLSQKWRRICRKQGTSVRLHDLRHAFASLALSEGASMVEVAAVLGHASPTITSQTYAHVVEGGARKTVDLVADLMGFGDAANSNAHGIGKGSES